jgi:hypothetical protein
MLLLLDLHQTSLQFSVQEESDWELDCWSMFFLLAQPRVAAGSPAPLMNLAAR